jgi:protein transport protein SEC20
MPPIPRTLDQDTLALISSAHRRANDLSECQIPRLRECRGPLSLQQNLAGELREDLDRFSRQVEVCIVRCKHAHRIDVVTRH